MGMGRRWGRRRPGAAGHRGGGGPCRAGAARFPPGPRPRTHRRCDAMRQRPPGCGSFPAPAGPGARSRYPYRSQPPPPRPRPPPPFLPLRRHRETTWAPGGRQPLPPPRAGAAPGAAPPLHRGWPPPPPNPPPQGTAGPRDPPGGAHALPRPPGASSPRPALPRGGGPGPQPPRSGADPGAGGFSLPGQPRGRQESSTAAARRGGWDRPPPPLPENILFPELFSRSRFHYGITFFSLCCAGLLIAALLSPAPLLPGAPPCSGGQTPAAPRGGGTAASLAPADPEDGTDRPPVPADPDGASIPASLPRPRPTPPEDPGGSGAPGTVTGAGGASLPPGQQQQR